MEQIKRVIYQLIRESLFPNIYTESVKIDESVWESVYQEMQEQAIDALPENWLKIHPISDSDLYKTWLRTCMLRKVRWVQVMVAQRNLLALLDTHKIECVIIKGVAAGMAYPRPDLRAMGDVDFLVKRVDFERTADILEASGYQLIGEKIASLHHYEYRKDGVVFELHKRLAIISENDEEMLSLFEEGIKRREFRSVNSFSFPVLSSELNGMVLLFHINQHLRSGLGLRQIIDWMMYLNENKDIQTIQPLLQKTGMERLANTVTVMCQEYLGLPKLVENTGDYPCEELIEYILAKGNFGQKSGENGKIAYVFLLISNPYRLFQRLQTGGLLRWKCAKKHKYLRPFAWIYQIGFIVRQLILYKVSPLKMFEIRKTGLEQRNLILSLGLEVDRVIKKED